MFGISTGAAGSTGAVGGTGGAFGTVGAFLGAMTISPLVDVTGDLKPDGLVKSNSVFSQKQFFAPRQAPKVVIKIIIDIFTIGIYSLSFFNSFYKLLRVVKIRIEKNAVSQ